MNEVTVFVGLGANLGDAMNTLRLAWQDILDLPGVEAGVCSSFYRSRPMDERDGPDYCNAVVAIEYTQDAATLLAQLQQLESKYGRQRTEDQWASRTLDLDILLFGDEVIDTADLIVPHYDMHNRDFVLIPLLEIAPYIEIPGEGDAQALTTALNSKLEVWMMPETRKG